MQALCRSTNLNLTTLYFDSVQHFCDCCPICDLFVFVMMLLLKWILTLATTQSMFQFGEVNSEEISNLSQNTESPPSNSSVHATITWPSVMEGKLSYFSPHITRPTRSIGFTDRAPLLRCLWKASYPTCRFRPRNVSVNLSHLIYDGSQPCNILPLFSSNFLLLQLGFL